MFKTITIQNLLDVNSQPWNADWYRKQVVRQLGTDQEMYRLYYTDNADHFETGPHPNNAFAPHIVSYQPVLYQALRDLAAWVEDGVEPPRNTQYSVDNAQISIPYEASQRGGIQPVVHLCVDYDQERIVIESNTSVEFRAVAEVPTEQGCIISVDWDFEGIGQWIGVDVENPDKAIEVFGSHTYMEAGIYFAAIRAGSSRTCQSKETLVVPRNLARVRVVVV